MEQVQFDFVFTELVELPNSNILTSQNWLCILHANKIPPHIGVSCNGLYFSLKAKGKDLNVSVNKVLKLLNDKKITSYFLRLNVDWKVEEINKIYQLFDKATGQKTSCLSPIKLLPEMNEEAQQLVDLLNFLKENQLYDLVYGINLQEGVQGILHYTPSAIEKRISLLHASRR